MVIKSDVCVAYDKTTGKSSYYRNDKLLDESEMNAIRSSGDIYFFPSCNRFASALRIQNNMTRVLIKEEQVKQLFEMLNELVKEYGSSSDPLQQQIQDSIQKLEALKDELDRLSDEKTSSYLLDALKANIQAMKVSMRDLQKRGSLAIQIKNLQDANSILQAQVNQLTKDLVDKESEKNALQALLNAKTVELNDLETRYNDLLTSSGNVSDQLRIDNQKLIDENQGLTNEVARLTNSINTLNAAIQDLQDKNNSMSQDDQAMTVRVNTLEGEIDRLNNNVQSVAEEKRQLENDLRVLQEDKRVTEQKYNDAIHLNGQKVKELEALTEKMVLKEQEIQELKDKYNSLSNAQLVDKQLLNRAYSKLVASLKVLKNRVPYLEQAQDLPNSDELESTLDRLQDEILRTNSSLQEKESRLAELTQERDDLQREYNNLDQKFKSSQDKVGILEKAIRALEEKNKEDQQREAQEDSTLMFQKEEREEEDRRQKALITSLETQIRELTSQVSEKDAQFSNQRDALNELVKKLAASEEEKNNISRKVEELELQKKQNSEISGQLAEEIRQLKDDYSKETDDQKLILEQLRNEVSQLKIQNNEKEEKLQGLRSNLQSTQNDLFQSQEKARLLEEQYASLQETTQILKSQLETATGASSEVGKERDSIRKQLEETQAELGKAKGEITMINANITQLKEQEDQLRRQVQNIETQGAEKEKQNRDLLGKLEELQKGTSDSQKTLTLLEETYRENLQQKEAEINRLEKEKGDIQESKEKLIKELNDQLAKKMEELAWYSSRQKELEQENTKINALYDDLNKDTLESISKKGTEIKTLRNELKSKEEDVDNLQKQLAELTSDLSKAQNKGQNAGNGKKQLETKLDQVRKELESSKSEMNKVTFLLEETERKVKSLEEKKELAEEESQKINAEKERQKIVYDNLIENNKEVIKSIEYKLEEKESELKNQLELLKSKEDAWSLEKRELEEKVLHIRSLQTENEDLKSTIQSLQDSNGTNTNQIQDLQNEISSLKEEIKKEKTSFGNKEQDLFKLKQEYEVLKSTNESLVNELNNIKENAESLELRIRQSSESNESEKKSWEEERKDLIDKQNKLSDEVNNQRNELSKQKDKLDEYESQLSSLDLLKTQKEEVEKKIEQMQKDLEEKDKLIEMYETDRMNTQKIIQHILGSNPDLDRGDSVPDVMKSLVNAQEKQKEIIRQLQEENVKLQEALRSSPTADSETALIKEELERVLIENEKLTKSAEASVVSEKIKEEIKRLELEIESLKKTNDVMGKQQFEALCLNNPNGPGECLDRIGQSMMKDVEVRLYFTSVFDSMKVAYLIQKELGKPIVGLLFKYSKSKLALTSALAIDTENGSSDKRPLEMITFSNPPEIRLKESNPVILERIMKDNDSIVLSFYNTIPSRMGANAVPGPDISDAMISELNNKLVLSYTFYAPPEETLEGDGGYIGESSKVEELKKEYEMLIGEKDEKISDQEKRIKELNDQLSQLLGQTRTIQTNSCDKDFEHLSKTRQNIENDLNYLSSDKLKQNQRAIELINILKIFKNDIDKIKDNSPDSCNDIKLFYNKHQRAIYDFNLKLADLKEDIGGSTRVYVRIKPDFYNKVDAKGKTEVDESGKPKKDFNRPIIDERISIVQPKDVLPKIKLNLCRTSSTEYGPFYGVIPDLNRGKTESYYPLIYDSRRENEPVTNEQVFSEFKSLIDQAKKGYSIIFFGYGLSGSGKTYTLLGSQSIEKDKLKINQKGLLQLAVNNLNQENYKVKVYQIKEELFKDFKIDTQTKKVTLSGQETKNYLDETAFTDQNNIFFNKYNPKEIKSEDIVLFKDSIKDSKVNISNEKNINVLIASVTKYRQDKGHIKQTVNNPESSRSHLYITLDVQDSNGNNKGYITFVDMAGRETPLNVVTDSIKNTDYNISDLITDFSLFSENQLQSRKYCTSINKNMPECKKIKELIKESFYINESINHLKWYLQTKQNKMIEKPTQISKLTEYSNEKVFNTPISSNVPTISILESLDKLGGVGKPSKFVMLCAVRTEKDYCDQTKSTIEFAQSIASTK